MNTSERKHSLLEQVLPKLRPFQRAAFDAATTGTSKDADTKLLSNGRLLLGDEMGLGKTVTSLAIMAHYESEWPLLIICPASLRYTWPGEMEKFFPSLSPQSIYVAKGFQDVGFAKRKDVKVIIVTYSLFQERSAVQETIKQHHYRCVICDESHNLKSRTSQRSKLILPILQKADRLLLLSGTPALAKPAELWTQLSCLAPKLFGNWTSFAKRYCNPRRKFFGGGRFSMDYSGSSNEEELHGKLKQVMIRRLKNDVLHELPAKQRSVVPVSIVSRDEVSKCKRVMQELSDTRTSVASLVGEEARNADFEARAKLMEAYKVCGTAKARAVAEYLLDWLGGSNQKVLVFAHHQAVLDTLDQALLKSHPNGHIRIDGSVAPVVRAQLVRKFQTCERVRVALLSVTAAGVGLTLTAASTVMFAELHWTPGVLAQAEDRAHRIGQQNFVQVLYMVCKDKTLSVDMSLWKLLGRKIHTLDQVVDGGKEDKPYLYNADEREADTKRGVSAQEELTEFFADTAIVEEKKRPKVAVKGSIERFFKKASQGNSSEQPKDSTRKRRLADIQNDHSPEATQCNEARERKQQKASPKSSTTTVQEKPDSSGKTRKTNSWFRQGTKSITERELMKLSCDVCTFEIAVKDAAKKWACCDACGNQMKVSKERNSADAKHMITWTCSLCTLTNEKAKNKTGWYTCDACKEPHTGLDEVHTPNDTKRPLAVTVTNDSTPSSAIGSSRRLRREVIGIDESPPPVRNLSRVSSSSPEIIVLDGTSSHPSSTRRKLPTTPEVVVVAGGEKQDGSTSGLLMFSVSKHSGRITIHEASTRSSTMVNFTVEEVVSGETADRLLDARIKKVSTSSTKFTLDFDTPRIKQMLARVKEQNAHLSIATMIQDVQSFVRKYVRLRAVEQKLLQELGEAVSASQVSQVVARLLVPSSKCVDRFVGGAKERALERQAKGEATASDRAVLDREACAWCATTLSKASLDTNSTYCSQVCAEQGRLRRGGKFASSSIRAALFNLEQGVCTLCGINAHNLFEQIQALQPPERLNKLLSVNWSIPKSGRALEKLLNDPKEGDFWQADHIKAVAEGGGDCGLENLRTLCVPCHKSETNKLHARRKLGDADSKRGQTDIRNIFQQSQKSRFSN